MQLIDYTKQFPMLQSINVIVESIPLAKTEIALNSLESLNNLRHVTIGLGRDKENSTVLVSVIISYNIQCTKLHSIVKTRFNNVYACLYRS